MTTLRPPEGNQQVALKLLAASQPDIVRATQKDDSYVQQYVEETREVVRRLFGPFRALQFARESKLLAVLLYHGLTTGSGSSTLGEEYCGLLQVTADGRPPGPLRRLLLSLLLSAGPYAADRLAGRLESAAQEGELEGAMGLEPEAAEADQDNEAGEAEEEAGALHAEGQGAGEEEEQQRAAEAEGGEGRRASGRGAGAGPGSARAAAAAARRGSGAGWLRLLAAAAARQWTRLWRALVRAWPRMRPLLSYAGRVHLALFYLYGAYYSLPHRLTGVRYSLSLRPLQGRPSYRFLGLLLALQLAASGAAQLRTVHRRWAAERAAAAQAGDGGAAGGAAGGGRGVRQQQRWAEEGEPAVLLDDEPWSDEEGGEEGSEEEEGQGESDGGGGEAAAAEVAEAHEGAAVGGWETALFGAPVQRPPTQQPAAARGGAQGADGGVHDAGRARRRRARQEAAACVLPVLTSQRQCPLCLSPKSYPTSTPCGHTFCWRCIATWCTEKPECPLCRADVWPQQLVALYHTNI